MTRPITCPACAASFTPATDLRGKKAFCPQCGQALIVTSAGVAKRDEKRAQAPAAARAPRWLCLTLALLLTISAFFACYFAWHRYHPAPENTVAQSENDPPASSGKVKRFVPADPESAPMPPKTKEGHKNDPAKSELKAITPVEPPNDPMPKKGPEPKEADARFILPLEGLGEEGRFAAVKGIYLEAKDRKKQQGEFPFAITWLLSGTLRFEMRIPDAFLTDATRPPAPGQPNFLVVYTAGAGGWYRYGPQIFDLKAEDVRVASPPTGLGFFELGGKDRLSGQRAKLSVVGSDTVKGRAVICVKTNREPVWCEGTKLYFDRATRLLAKEEHRALGELGPQGQAPVAGKPLVESYFSDYRETEGIHWPGTTQIYTNGVLSDEIEITSLRLLREVDESLFRRP